MSGLDSTTYANLVRLMSLKRDASVLAQCRMILTTLDEAHQTEMFMNYEDQELVLEQIESINSALRKIAQRISDINNNINH